MECPDNSIIKKTDTQGCLTVSFENKNSIKVSVNHISNQYNVSITEVGNNAIISMDRIGGISTTTATLVNPSGSISFNRKSGGISVHHGIVCTVSLGDNGEQMWWCDQWRVLWNNGIPTLWRS